MALTSPSNAVACSPVLEKVITTSPHSPPTKASALLVVLMVSSSNASCAAMFAARSSALSKVLAVLLLLLPPATLPPVVPATKFKTWAKEEKINNGETMRKQKGSVIEDGIIQTSSDKYIQFVRIKTRQWLRGYPPSMMIVEAARGCWRVCPRPWWWSTWLHPLSPLHLYWL